jgi:hypothetical protein
VSMPCALVTSLPTRYVSYLLLQTCLEVAVERTRHV